MNHEKCLRYGKGFTLIEITIVIVILGILSVFTFSFIDSAVKTYTIASKQRLLYQQGSYIMERISRELRDAEWVTNSTFYVNSLYFYRPDLSATNVVDKNQYVLILRDNSNNLYRFSRSTSDPFWVPSLSANNVIGRNVTRFVVNLTTSGQHLNDYANITLELTDPQDSTMKVTMQETMSPKNPIGLNCFWWPWLFCTQTYDYTNRSFNGDYEDIVQ
ncbi:MAG TPA: type II secretion system protein [Syntrophorhabdaceae bacterium]|nr:type II secretion system protein [Syntrophorhabdaceae bacterium]